MNKSFTLIEILVVIVVIGVLSAFILVGMNSITSSASIAKGKAFANSVRNSLLISLVSEWKFEGPTAAEGTVTTNDAKDSWGSNNATVIGGNPLIKSSNCVSGKCIAFDGTGDVISIPNSTTFNFGSYMSVFFWAKAAASVTETYIISKYAGGGQYGFLMASSSSGPGRFVIYLYDDGTENENHHKSWLTSSIVFDNSWHLYGFVWNAGTGYIYIDGLSVPYTNGGNLTTNSIWNSTANFCIGGICSGNYVGSLDEIQIYNQPLSTSQIQEDYYSGLNNLFKNNRITSVEFSRKLIELKSSLIEN